MGKPYSKHCEDLFAMGFQSGIGLRSDYIADLLNLVMANAICR
jgi:hypothetical protein